MITTDYWVCGKRNCPFPTLFSQILFNELCTAQMSRIASSCMLLFLINCFFLAQSIVETESTAKRRLKVLVYSPSMSWSHAQFLGRIADVLQEAGHEVHFLKLATDASMRLKNETKRVQRVHLAHPKLDQDKIDITKMSMIQDSFAGNWPLLNALDHPIEHFMPLCVHLCREIIGQTEMLDRLAREHFDVGIAEMYDPCTAGILHRLEVRTKIAVFAIPLFQNMARRYGIPGFASFMPNMVTANLNVLDNTFVQRALNFYNEIYDWAWIDDKVYVTMEPIVRQAFGADFPSLKELERNVSLVLINSNPFFEVPRPMSNKIVHIGGIVDQGKGKGVLDKRSQRILDNASSGGAVLFSFGSIADTRTMSAQMRGNILRAFSRFPTVQFLWKLDSSSRQNDSALLAALPNVHTFDWLPQTAVLQHPNLRAFISHCGQNSLTEAARAGVPVLGIPLFGDQLYNALVARHRGMALQVDVRQLNGPEGEEVLTEALEKILHESSFARNAQLVSRKLALTPFSPSERLVRWVEFAAEFPDLDELNLPGDDQLHWFVYYSLDVLLFTFIILFFLTWLATKCALIVWKQLTKLQLDSLIEPILSHQKLKKS